MITPSHQHESTTDNYQHFPKVKMVSPLKFSIMKDESMFKKSTPVFLKKFT